MVLEINNQTARALWLSSQGLSTPPTGELDLIKTVTDLGFVQLDTIRNVTRAHHHILWTRNQNYREPMFGKLLAQDRTVFEHFTHDASVIPMAFLPMWRRQFTRKKQEIESWKNFARMPDAKARAQIKARIANEGPLSTHAFDTKVIGKKQMWSRPPHKMALDYMWYAGELATSHRENFKKFYDLAESVFPPSLLEVNHPDEVQVDWLCAQALDRLGFGTTGEIQRFWGAMSAKEAKHWCENTHEKHVPVSIQNDDKSWSAAYAPINIEQRINQLNSPGSAMKILSPFDPAIRDRARTARLFGFDYRIEIFVPAAKRKWGYYVYPLLEGNRFVGRIDLKADRKKAELYVINVWPEDNVKWGDARWAKLYTQLNRLCRLIGCDNIVWKCDIKRP